MVPEKKPAQPALNHNSERHIGIAYLFVITAVVAGSLFLIARPVTMSGREMPVGIETRLDPNTASAAQLSRLPGIGPGLADRIIAARHARNAGGPAFRSPEDLASVRGLGARRLDSLRRYLRFPDLITSKPIEVSRPGAPGAEAQPGRRSG